MRHSRIARHLGTNFVVECYMGPDQQDLSSKSILALSDTLASVSRVNEQLLAKEEARVNLETNLYFELQGLSFNTKKLVPRSQQKSELLWRKQKMLEQLEKELKLSSLRFASLVKKQQEQEVEERKEKVGSRMLHPELESQLRQSSFQLARLVEDQQEVESQDDGGEDDFQRLFHFPSNNCLNLNQRHLEEIDKERMEQMHVVIQSGLYCGDWHLLKEEEEISQSSLQLASLMENSSLSMEEGSEGSSEDCGLQQLPGCQVNEETGLMTPGKDSWDWRSRGDDHECGNDAWLLIEGGWSAAKQVNITHTKSRRTTLIIRF